MRAKKSTLATRLAEFAKLQRLAKQHSVTMLPMERIGDGLYFRDKRLQQYRNVENPHDGIAFREYAMIPPDQIRTPCGGWILGLEYNEVCSTCGNRCYEDAKGR